MHEAFLKEEKLGYSQKGAERKADILHQMDWLKDEVPTGTESGL